jgi:inorganic triphosphatase YgiF
MKQEIEVKLSIGKDEIASLLNCEFMCQFDKAESEKHLQNTYYDTPELALHEKKIALRVRSTGDNYFQTLKTQGTSYQGFSQRSEWEWEINKPELDTSLLPADAWPDQIDPHQLKAQFTTHFTRRLWYLRIIDNNIETLIEIALDQGEIAVSSKPERIAICELELELKEGDAEQLKVVSEKLKAQCPALKPSDVSKALRGYQLLTS